MAATRATAGSTSEQNLCRGTSFTSTFRSVSKFDWRQVLVSKISCSGYNSFVHILKFSYRVKDFFQKFALTSIMNNSIRDISTDQAHVWAGSYSSTGAYIAMLVE